MSSEFMKESAAEAKAILVDDTLTKMFTLCQQNDLEPIRALLYELIEECSAAEHLSDFVDPEIDDQDDFF